MPKRRGTKMNMWEKRNKSLKVASALMAEAGMANAMEEYEQLKKALIYSSERVAKLKRQIETERAIAIMVIGTILITTGVLYAI